MAPAGFVRMFRDKLGGANGRGGDRSRDEQSQGQRLGEGWAEG